MFIHAFVEGFKNILQEKRISLTAIVILFVSIMSICIIGTFWIFLSYGIRVLDKEIQIVAFIEKKVTPEQREQLISDIKAIDGVRNVEYINNDTGKQNLVVKNTYLEAFKDNLERTKPDVANFDYLVVYPEDSEKYNTVYNELNKESFKANRLWKDIPNMLETVGVLKSIYRAVQIIGIILIIIFAVISYLVMANIFQIMIYHHKNEIEIQRLVGATNGYIRSPFMAQGIIYYLFSSILSLICIIPLINYILPFLSTFIGTTSTQNELRNTVFSGSAGIIGLGFLVGIVITYLSIERYLKK
ncbi:MAG: cell division protein FtsX [Patescibacteria group bacterium]